MDVVKRLQNHNIKPSVQRIAIMNYLIEHRTHPTVDEIYTALSPSIPTLSKTTVQYLETTERARCRTNPDYRRA